jgi:integrase
MKKGGRVVRRVMQDGTVKLYRYPAYKKPRKSLGDTVGELITSWEGSPEWRALADSTKAGYATYLRPLIGMERVRIKDVSRRELIAIRNAIAAERGNGAATAFVRTTSALFGWAIEAGHIDYSPMIKVKRLPGGHLPAWSAADVEMALPALPEHLRRPIILALYTGQRRGDLIRMPWSAYDGTRIKLVQEKTDAPLTIAVPEELRAELDAWRASASATLILTNKFGRPWKASNLSKQLGDALTEIDGFPPHRNIHGLRKLAAANLAQAGCTLHEIASITGHKSLAMLQLYTASIDQERAAEGAIIKLAAYRLKRGVK